MPKGKKQESAASQSSRKKTSQPSVIKQVWQNSYIRLPIMLLAFVAIAVSAYLYFEQIMGALIPFFESLFEFFLDSSLEMQILMGFATFAATLFVAWLGSRLYKAYVASLLNSDESLSQNSPPKQEMPSFVVGQERKRDAKHAQKTFLEVRLQELLKRSQGRVCDPCELVTAIQNTEQAPEIPLDNSDVIQLYQNAIDAFENKNAEQVVSTLLNAFANHVKCGGGAEKDVNEVQLGKILSLKNKEGKRLGALMKPDEYKCLLGKAGITAMTKDRQDEYYKIIDEFKSAFVEEKSRWASSFYTSYHPDFAKCIETFQKMVQFLKKSGFNLELTDINCLMQIKNCKGQTLKEVFPDHDFSQYTTLLHEVFSFAPSP